MGEEVTMLESLFFALGVVNSLCLILVFVLRKRRLDLIQRFGWLYLLLAIPAAYGIVLAQQDEQARQQGLALQYTVFLAIYLGFLALEGLYDWVLKLPFRETMDWRLLGPYIALYVGSSYGFVVMVWRYDSVLGGLLLLALTVAQLLANLVTHPRATSRG